MAKELKCTEYMTYDADDPNWYSPKCPQCGGFIKGTEDIVTCKKCGTKLIFIPEVVDGEEMDFGKICPISRSIKK